MKRTKKTIECWVHHHIGAFPKLIRSEIESESENRGEKYYEGWVLLRSVSFVIYSSVCAFLIVGNGGNRFTNLPYKRNEIYCLNRNYRCLKMSSFSILGLGHRLIRE